MSGETRSALYEGRVRHRRAGPRRHAFRYRLILAYLDLDELPELLDRCAFASARRPSLAWFRRADYLGPRDVPLKEAVLDRVEERLGRRPGGAVRVLTHLRTLGYVFNPVTFYYCFDEDERLEAVVAEITNTPWRERHAYVLDARGRAGGRLRWRFAKDFHVSPFLGMDQDYEWRLTVPGERLAVHMTNLERGQPVFTANLACRRRELTRGALLAALARHPLLTFRVHAAIYLQAALLRWKRAPFFVHPRKRASSTPA